MIRRSIVPVGLSAFLSLLAPFGGAAQPPLTPAFEYRNPLDFAYPYDDGTKVRTITELRDPAIIREGDTYFLVFTHLPFTHHTSRDPKKVDYNSSPGIRLRAMAAKGKVIPEVLAKVEPLLAEKPPVIAPDILAALKAEGPLVAFEVLLEANPRLVLLRSSGFGQTGPYTGRAAFNPVGLAFGGITYLNGWPDRPPLRDGVMSGDYTTALFNVLGTMAALLRRDVDGRGQVVDTAMFEAALRLTGAGPGCPAAGWSKCR